MGAPTGSHTLYAPPCAGAKMGRVNPEEVLTVTKLDGPNLTEASRPCTIGRVGPRHGFGAGKIRAARRGVRIPMRGAV